MIFRHTQPKTENDIKSNGDCMVRAVTIITNSEYGKVHKLMYNNGWRSSKRTDKDWESQITNTLVVSVMRECHSLVLKVRKE